MKTVLVITSVASMVDQFLFPTLELFQNMEYEVHVACNFEKGNTCSDERVLELKSKLRDRNILYHQIDFAREVSKVSENIRAYKEVYKLVSDHKYDLIHCHSPIGGLIARLAARNVRKNGTKVFYTAHGFHFYKGAPLKNWLLYYPVEKLCAHFTDVLITINQEDYALAQKKMKAKRVEYVPGVGIDLTKFGQVAVDKSAKRKELGIPEDAMLLLSVGELNKNKNHETVIRAIKDLDVYYIIAGKGDLQEHLQSVIDELGLTNRVKLIGFRSDITELCAAADLFVFPSFREGLSRSLMEAMASGLPCVVSNIRGNADLIEDGKGGFLCTSASAEEFAAVLQELLQNAALRQKMGKNNRQKIKKFDVSVVENKMRKIYSAVFEEVKYENFAPSAK